MHWKLNLTHLGLNPKAYQLHGLRKAAATEAYDQGANELDIQRYGGWRSNVHRQYITTHSNASVNQKLIKSLTSA